VKNDVDWMYPEAIVECNWLSDQLSNGKIRVYDCTTYLHYTDDHPLKPYDVESGLSNYEKGHIPTAALLDLQNDLSDNKSPFRFTLPQFDTLAEAFKNIGIGEPYRIILYSSNGMQWATRVWSMLYTLGYENVSILNGGFMEWQRLGLPTETKTNEFEREEFQVKIRPDIFIENERVFEAIEDPTVLLLNALTADLHSGDNSRYGRPGRIPSSLNIPFNELIEADTGKFKPPEEVMQIFADKGITSDLNIINYCGGGIAATLNAFVLRQVGFKKLQIYDNSMSEWAMDKNFPIETD